MRVPRPLSRPTLSSPPSAFPRGATRTRAPRTRRSLAFLDEAGKPSGLSCSLLGGLMPRPNRNDDSAPDYSKMRRVIIEERQVNTLEHARAAAGYANDVSPHAHNAATF